MARGIACPLALAAMLTMVGCAGFRAPVVAITEVAIAETGDEALGVVITMDLRNPNAAPLELDEFRYTMSINGTQVYAGRRAGGVTIGAAGSRRLTIPAVITDERAGWMGEGRPSAAEYSVSGRLVYYAPNRLAQVLFDTGTRKPKVKFTGRGTMQIP